MTRINIDTQTGYDRWSAIYDDDLNPLVLLEEDVVRTWIVPAPLTAAASVSSGGSKPLAGKHVADVGCGTGRHSAWLADQGAAVNAYDFSTGMLDRARPKLEQHGVRIFEHALPNPLPVERDTFDLTLFALVADHMADLVVVFQDLRRVTRSSGECVFTVLHPAMNLLGLTARFRDPESGNEVRVQAFEHTYADYVMGVLRAGWKIDELVERKADHALAARTPRAEKYLGWPLLLAMRLK